MRSGMAVAMRRPCQKRPDDAVEPVARETVVTLALIAIAALLAIAFLPGAWVRSVIARHSEPRADLPGPGSVFARRTLDRMGLQHVTVEETTDGDHYDPKAKAVRLASAHFKGHSLAALVIAAHEIGHAMQDAADFAPLKHRTTAAHSAARAQKIGGVIMLAAPLVVLALKTPYAIMLDVLAGAAMFGSAAMMHVFTLPVEFDASFNRAMPLLRDGKLIPKADLPAARSLLRAAAYTYVASALMTLVDVTRWFRVFRF
mgnify:CR=1 FL=1